jgi:CO/xanthine dehydrogenase FAD-binding subunit
MKPPPFTYHVPKTLDEALSLLTQYGSDAKILAGGQSLVPMMNFRVAQPAMLIDINRIKELAYIKDDSNGVRIGAMTRQRTIERDATIAKRAPLLHETVPHIAHPQIRNRGTIGGSVAHADPAAELPTIMLTLNAKLLAKNAKGERWIEAKDFFVGLFTTALEPDEILAEIQIPDLPARSGYAFEEAARRHGDYAMMGAAATMTLDESGNCKDVHLVFLSVGETPLLSSSASKALVGNKPTPELIQSAAANTDITPSSNIHASERYRKHLANVLGKRVLTKAYQRAQGAEKTTKN